MLEEISGMYSSVFGTKAGPDREKHPVVFLPDGSKKVDIKLKMTRCTTRWHAGARIKTIHVRKG